MKVKMIARHSSPWGKLEQGLEYDLVKGYAEALVKAGIAVPIMEALPVMPIEAAPGYVAVKRTPPKARVPKIYAKKRGG